ncbi:MAG: hypothetical protein K8T10_09070 [Candidatus Eremiobacteraeota bacterium]|nr:hypothetical protein [Candidatus Eremiobacteraeota bacterium]
MRVEISRRAQKEIDLLPLHIRTKVVNEILSFEDDPGSVDLKKIKGKKNYYRVRAGDMRIGIRVTWKKGIAIVERVVNRKYLHRI